MSSSKYQPNPKKRTIEQVTPEFPSLPLLSLAAAQEFATKSQTAVEYALQTLNHTPKPAFLFLPLISPHGLQQRFSVEEDESVFVIIRKSYSMLKGVVVNMQLRSNCGIYVRGPVGVGKSYLLYLLAAEFRLNRQYYRVTYINDCAQWRDDKFGYILREFVSTFYDDTIGEKSIVVWCERVIGSDKEEKMFIMMMEALINYVKGKRLQWIVICDQHNALYTHDEVLVQQFPFNVISYLSRKRGSNIKVVISASANNEGHPTEMKGWYTHDISSHRFDEDEFKVWCGQYLLNDDDNPVDPTHEDAIDALYWSGNLISKSGGVPHELDLLWKQPKETLIEKTMLYREKRVEEMAESHGKFYEKLVDKKKENLIECISRMALVLSPPKIKIGMDRQLFDIVPDTNGMDIITSLNPVARDALLTCHGQGLMISIGLVAELVFQGDYTNDTKGRIIEKYIITMLELSQRFSFKSTKTTNTGISTVNPVVKMVEIKDIIHFSGNKLPLRNAFNQRVVTLFVPKSSNYPGLDFFIWNPVDEVLMAFQVTVKNPFTTHPKIDGASDNCMMWLDFCFDGLKKKPMDIYWIIPESCVGKPKNFEGRLVLLKDLWADFPALQKLTL